MPIELEWRGESGSRDVQWRQCEDGRVKKEASCIQAPQFLLCQSVQAQFGGACPHSLAFKLVLPLDLAFGHHNSEHLLCGSIFAIWFGIGLSWWKRRACIAFRGL